MKIKLIILLLSSMSMQATADSLYEEYGFTDDKNVNIALRHSDQSKSDEVLNNRGFLPVHYTAVNGVNFLGRTSAFNGAGGFNGGRNCVNGSTEKFIDHELRMGTNDVLDGIRVWGNDGDAAQDLGIILYRTCLPAFSGDGIFSEVFFNETIPSTTGEVSQFFNTNFTFEGLERECKIMVRARFGLPGTCNGIQDISLYKVRAQLNADDLIFKENMQEF